MRCPRCRSALATFTAEGVRFERCAACHGVAIAIAVLRRFAPQDRVRAIWVNSPAGQPGVACPSCGKAMRETPIATGAEHLALDVCKPCQLLWFDATELAQFSPARQAPPPRTDRLSPDAAEALFLAEAEGRETLELAEEQAAAISAVACAALGSNLFSLVLLKRLAERRT